MVSSMVGYRYNEVRFLSDNLTFLRQTWNCEMSVNVLLAGKARGSSLYRSDQR